MTAIGEAASLAGLIGLAGLAIQAASSLYNIIKAYKNIHPKIQEIASNLEALRTCLSDVRRTALHADAVHSNNHPEVAEISSCVKSCNELFDQIKTQLDSVKPRATKRKKLKIAVEDDFFISIYHQLSVRHQRLLTLLSTATWYTSLETFSNVGNLSITANEIKNGQIQSTQQIKTQLTSMDSSLRLFMSQTAASDNVLEHKIDTILQATTSINTQNQLAAIEAKLASLQIECQQAINTAQSRIATVGSSHHAEVSMQQAPEAIDPSASLGSLDEKQPREFLMKIIDTALVLKVRRGQVTYGFEPTEDKTFTALSISQKKIMVQYLRSLRLVLWLLRRENHVAFASSKNIPCVQASALRQASMKSQLAGAMSRPSDKLVVAFEMFRVRLQSIFQRSKIQTVVQSRLIVTLDSVRDGRCVSCRKRSMTRQEYKSIYPTRDEENRFVLLLREAAASNGRSMHDIRYLLSVAVNNNLRGIEIDVHHRNSLTPKTRHRPFETFYWVLSPTGCAKHPYSSDELWKNSLVIPLPVEERVLGHGILQGVLIYPLRFLNGW